MSNAPTRSYLKVPYDLRMAKQIERRMIVDALSRMSVAFNIKRYRYVGMGSIYFVDYIMFHKFLGMSDLVSVEYSEEIEKRIKFNRPFNCIKIEFGPIGDVVAALDKDQEHLVWLDYDDVMQEFMLLDVVTAATTLSRRSMLLMTVDAEPPVRDGTPAKWKRHFEKVGRGFVNRGRTTKGYAQSKLAEVNTEMLLAAVRQGLSGRTGLRFIPMFNFLYADGHLMLTIGGMIGNEQDERQLRSCDFSDAVYFRNSFSEAPYSVPLIRVTRKERFALDSAMPPSRNTWSPRDFELEEHIVREYREVYRYLPSYAELLL
jgi:hypothetical protein